MKKGIFITIEGGEGSGKTTLISRLEKELAGQSYQVLLTREPGGCELGDALRQILLHSNYKISNMSELCLFLASRAQHIQDVILPALDRKKIVICDRFNDSTFAYQGYARGIGLDEVISFCNFVCRNLEPNLTLYLDIDPKIGFARVKNKGLDRIESDKISFHQKIRKGFLLLAKKFSKRIHIIDASLPSDEVFSKALQLIRNIL